MLLIAFGYMKKQIKAISSQCCTSDSVNLENDTQASNEVLFSKRSDKHNNANNCCAWNRSSNFTLKAKNPLSSDGQPIQCFICKSIMLPTKSFTNKGGTQKDSDGIHLVFPK